MPLPLAELLVMLLLRAAEAVGPARRKSHGSTEGNTVGSAGGGPRRSCPGCLSCSEENGCLSCRDKLFLYIGREGLRQVGLCLHDCPRGHFGLRAHDANRCKRCSSTCESCFSQDFCIRCSGGFFLHKGKCQPTCPPGTEPRPGDARECQESCEASGWSPWGGCGPPGRASASPRGLETRTRQEPPACLPRSQARTCPLRARCQSENSVSRRRGKKERTQQKERKPEPSP